MKTSSLINDIEYNENKPAIDVLFETENTKEIRIAMRDGQIMKEHKTAYPIVVEMFEGTLDFGVNGDILNLKKGDILSLEGNVPHDLKATSDSIIRLSLSKLDKVERVRFVID
jgi:quercetin dioxygenase-like cupin family protein